MFDKKLVIGGKSLDLKYLRVSIIDVSNISLHEKCRESNIITIFCHEKYFCMYRVFQN